MKTPISFLKLVLAPAVFEALMERIDDPLTQRLLVIYSWVVYALAEWPEAAPHVLKWIGAALEALEEAEHDY